MRGREESNDSQLPRPLTPTLSRRERGQEVRCYPTPAMKDYPFTAYTFTLAAYSFTS